LSDFINLEKKTSLKRRGPTIKAEGNSTRVYYKILDILFALYKEHLYDNENDNRLIKRSQVLFHKGFYKEGVKQLNKVIYRGYTYSYLLRIEAIELKIKAAIKFVDVEYINENFENDKKLLGEFSNLYFNLVEFESIWAIIKVESTTNYFFGKSNTFSEKYKSILENEDKALSPNAKVYFNQINAFLAMKNGKPDQAYNNMQRIRVLYNWYPEIKENNYNEYLRSNRNLCIVLMYQKRFHEALEVIEGIANSPELAMKIRLPAMKNDIFALIVLLRMDIIISSSAINENADRIKDFEVGLEESEKFIALDEKATCCFYLSLMHLSAGNYKQALKFVNPAIELSGVVRKDVHHLSLMAELAIHYVLGNTDLLFSRLVSYKRIIEKGEVVFSFEKKLPKLLNDVFERPNQVKYFNALCKEIDASLEEENKLVYKPFMALFLLKST